MEKEIRVKTEDDASQSIFGNVGFLHALYGRFDPPRVQVPVKLESPAILASSAQTKSFPFDALPAEIRNAVYELLFIMPSRILLKLTRKVQPTDFRPNDTPKLRAFIGSFSHSLIGDLRKKPFQLTSGLILAHPSIVEECQSFIYSRNSFAFDMQTGYHFLKRIGKARAYLTDVKIMDSDLTDTGVMQIVRGLLIDAKQLTQLHLEFRLPNLGDIPHDGYLCSQTDCHCVSQNHLNVLARALVDLFPHFLRAVRIVPTLHPSNFSCDCIDPYPISAYIDWRTEEFCFHYGSALDRLQPKMQELLRTHTPPIRSCRYAWDLRKTDASFIL